VRNLLMLMPGLSCFLGSGLPLHGEDLNPYIRVGGLDQFANGFAGNGRSFGVLPDLDGDHLSEFALRRYEDGIPGKPDGTVWVGRGADFSNLVVLRGSKDLDDVSDFGWHLASGDVDGDGARELLVGWPFFEIYGAILAYDTKTWQLKKTYRGSEELVRIGYVFDSGFDYDDDGLEDILAGAPGTPGAPGDYNQGAVTVLSGATGLPFFIVPGLHAGESFPRSLEVVYSPLDGSLEGFLAGSSRYREGTEFLGRALYLSGQTGQVLWEKTGRRNRIHWYGSSVLSMGDLNADGIGDFAVDSGSRDFTEENIHVIQVFLGGVFTKYFEMEEHLSDSWYSTIALSSFMSEDVNGDGVRDVISPILSYDPKMGNFFIFFSGADGSLLDVWDREQGGGLMYYEYFHSMGDVSGDGRDDLLMVDPWYHPEREPRVYSIPMLRLEEGDSTVPDALVLDAPGHGRGLFQLLVSSGRDVGVPLGLRRIPLNPGGLFDWSYGRFIHGVLDDRGHAEIALDPLFVPEGLRQMTDLYVGWIGYHPDWLNSVSVISNSIQIH